MKKIIVLLLCLILIGCATPQVISTPPASYKPSRPTSDKELIKEWQRSLMKIKEWQVWSEINELVLPVHSRDGYTNGK